MGVLTVTLGTTAQQITRNRTIADSDITDRLIPAFRRAYGSTLNNQQLMDAFFNEIERYMLGVVRRHERLTAEETLSVPGDLPIT